MAGLLSPPAPAGWTAGDPVAAELHTWGREPFDARRANCGISIIDYAERETGGEVLPSPRELGLPVMLALAADRQLFLEYATWALRQLGCAITGAPVRGDVGLVDLPGSGTTAALCLGSGKWAARMARGVAIGAAEVLRAWEVRCPPR